MADLCNEILVNIFRFLTFRDRRNLAPVCKNWSLLCNLVPSLQFPQKNLRKVILFAIRHNDLHLFQKTTKHLQLNHQSDFPLTNVVHHKRHEMFFWLIDNFYLDVNMKKFTCFKIASKNNDHVLLQYLFPRLPKNWNQIKSVFSPWTRVVFNRRFPSFFKRFKHDENFINDCLHLNFQKCHKRWIIKLVKHIIHSNKIELLSTLLILCPRWAFVWIVNKFYIKNNIKLPQSILSRDLLKDFNDGTTLEFAAQMKYNNLVFATLLDKDLKQIQTYITNSSILKNFLLLEKRPKMNGSESIFWQRVIANRNYFAYFVWLIFSDESKDDNHFVIKLSNLMQHFQPKSLLSKISLPLCLFVIRLNQMFNNKRK